MSRSRRAPKRPCDYSTAPRSYRDLFIAKRRAQVRNAMRNGKADSLPVVCESGKFTSCAGYYW